MSSFTIHQRTRENQIVKTYAGNTLTTSIGAVTGIETDRAFFWLSSAGLGLVSGVISQVDLPAAQVVREFSISPSGNGTTLADLAFNGENFGLLHGLGDPSRLMLIDRRGNFLTPAPGLACGAAANGVAFDGSYYYVLVNDTLGFSPPFILQIERTGSTFVIVRNVSLALGGVGGLTFDGEFLVTHPRMPQVTAMDLYYLDRRNMDVVKTRAGETSDATYQNGMTFDGEYIYTLQSEAE